MHIAMCWQGKKFCSPKCIIKIIIALLVLILIFQNTIIKTTWTNLTKFAAPCLILNINFVTVCSNTYVLVNAKYKSYFVHAYYNLHMSRFFKIWNRIYMYLRTLGIKVWNLKIDFNTSGAQRVKQWTLIMTIYNFT